MRKYQAYQEQKINTRHFYRSLIEINPMHEQIFNFVKNDFKTSSNYPLA